MFVALLASLAFAGDAPAPAAPVDCAPLTGDAKTTCENQNALTAAQAALTALGDFAALTGDPKTQCDTKHKELEAQITSLTALLAPPQKGGKAVRSNTNRLESESSDE